MYNILVCDDDSDIVNALKIYLSTKEYTVLTASNGLEAVEMVEKHTISLILLDIMMPVMDGINAMVKIRQTSNIPIILLTAKSEDSDKILGLDIGADDYITKPFNPIEVIARVKSQLRRYTQLGSDIIQENIIKIGGIEINNLTKGVTVDGEQIRLTPTEYDILMLLMKTPGKVFAPTDIYTKIWSDTPLGAQNTIAVHIRHLREKIEINPGEPRYIKVVWGQGYRMESDTNRDRT